MADRKPAPDTPTVTKLGWFGLAAAFLAFYLIARVVELDLGYFGVALLIAAAAFGVTAVVTPRAKEPQDG